MSEQDWVAAPCGIARTGTVTDWADDTADAMLDLDASSGDVAELWITALGREPVSIGSASYEWMAGVRDTLAREIAAALRAERERCAAIADTNAARYTARMDADGEGYEQFDLGGQSAARLIALDIRGVK